MTCFMSCFSRFLQCIFYFWFFCQHKTLSPTLPFSVKFSSILLSESIFTLSSRWKSNFVSKHQTLNIFFINSDFKPYFSDFAWFIFFVAFLIISFDFVLFLTFFPDRLCLKFSFFNSQIFVLKQRLYHL